MVQPASKRLVRESDLGNPATPAGAALSASYAAHTADPTATAAHIAALTPGSPYVVIQRSPFDIFEGVA